MRKVPCRTILVAHTSRQAWFGCAGCRTARLLPLLSTCQLPVQVLAQMKGLVQEEGSPTVGVFLMGSNRRRRPVFSPWKPGSTQT